MKKIAGAKPSLHGGEEGCEDQARPRAPVTLSYYRVSQGKPPGTHHLFQTGCTRVTRDLGRLWGFIGEEASRYRRLAENWRDPNRRALLELAAGTLESIADEVLNGRVSLQSIESLARLARLFRTFGLPYKKLEVVRRLVSKYVDYGYTESYLAGVGYSGEPIGLPA